jgi:hypothetical protein
MRFNKEVISGILNIVCSQEGRLYKCEVRVRKTCPPDEIRQSLKGVIWHYLKRL